MVLYLNILTVVLLALVGGLLLTLFFQMKTWRATNREAPLLAEKLAESMLSARKGLSDLKQGLVSEAPELNRLISEGDKLRVELQFLLQRGAQLANKLDGQEHSVMASADDDMPTVRLSGATQAVVEQVAVANGQAAKPPVQPMADVAKGNARGGDPLEELLANLQTAPAEPIRKSKRKRVGPVTQAELDLQQSLQRDAA